MSTTMVQISAISTEGGLPKADDPRVRELIESIKEIGLLNPVTLIDRHESMWKLVAGRHRLAAMKALGESVVDANVLDLDELGAELATIVEYLLRRVLPALARADQLARRKEIYETMHPTAKHGGAPGKKAGKGGKGKDETISSFAADTAKKTGVTERSVQQYVAVSKRLDPEVKKKIAKTEAAESLTELTKLSRMPAEKQRQVAERVSKGQTVKAATRELKRAEQVAQVRAHTPPIGEYPVIVIDPPWPYEDQLDGSDAARGGTPYPTMTIGDICELALPLAKDAAVFLWVTNSHLVDPLAYAQVATAWEQRYGLVPKQIRTWIKPRMGLGRVWRNDTEHLVLFTRGRPVFAPVTQTTSLMAPLGAHSVKPQQAYDDVWELCPAEPKLEMFARGERKGFVANGAEVAKESARLMVPPEREIEAEAIEAELPPAKVTAPPIAAKKKRKLPPIIDVPPPPESAAEGIAWTVITKKTVVPGLEVERGKKYHVERGELGIGKRTMYLLEPHGPRVSLGIVTEDHHGITWPGGVRTLDEARSAAVEYERTGEQPRSPDDDEEARKEPIPFDAISWVTKKHPTKVAVGVAASGRRYAIDRLSRVAATGKKIDGYTFRWFCTTDGASSLGDFPDIDRAKANAGAAEQEHQRMKAGATA
jgi:N6-adenosine-specific RNA methylase IME4